MVVENVESPIMIWRIVMCLSACKRATMMRVILLLQVMIALKVNLHEVENNYYWNCYSMNTYIKFVQDDDLSWWINFGEWRLDSTVNIDLDLFIKCWRWISLHGKKLFNQGPWKGTSWIDVYIEKYFTPS